VLDPFAGSGTVLAVTKQLGRRYLGIELNPAYIGLAQDRLASVQPSLWDQEEEQSGHGTAFSTGLLEA
jgi:DNA modification methylase